MANLIDSTFFVGDINIPNTSKQEINESLNLFIGRHETELLTNLLGKTLYDAFKENPDDERFVELKNQLIYEINGQKYSLIAYYVYWFWVKDKAIWNSGIGTVRPKPDSATEISPAIKMVDSWNRFSELTCGFLNWIDGSENYPEWSGKGVYHNYNEYSKTNDFDI